MSSSASLGNLPSILIETCRSEILSSSALYSKPSAYVPSCGTSTVTSNGSVFTSASTLNSVTLSFSAALTQMPAVVPNTRLSINVRHRNIDSFFM